MRSKYLWVILLIQLYGSAFAEETSETTQPAAVASHINSPDELTLLEARVLGVEQGKPSYSETTLHDGDEWEIVRVRGDTPDVHWCTARAKLTWGKSVSLIPIEDERIQLVLLEGRRIPQGPWFTLYVKFITANSVQGMEVGAATDGHYMAGKLSDTESDYFLRMAILSKTVGFTELRSKTPLLTQEIGHTDMQGFAEAAAALSQCAGDDQATTTPVQMPGRIDL